MTPMRLLMLGAPGAGKGTQASGLAARFGLEHIASGALLRREVRDDTPLGRHVGSYLDRGDLIPDDLMLDVIGPRVAAASAFVLDGFPRSLAQERAAEQRGLFDGRPLDAAVFLEVATDELLRRLLERARDQGRSDDREETIRHRLSLFDAETQPLIDCYREADILVAVDGDQDPEKVTRAIIDQLDAIGLISR
jgi:adenylate kinase